MKKEDEHETDEEEENKNEEVVPYHPYHRPSRNRIQHPLPPQTKNKNRQKENEKKDDKKQEKDMPRQNLLIPSQTRGGEDGEDEEFEEYDMKI